MIAFLASLGFVILAEMGDKTQLLAMCLAVRYPWQTVIWGVFVATLMNHLFAVLAGNYMTTVLPMEYVTMGAALSFIVFGFWTIRGDTLSCDTRIRSSPFWTVAMAFFFAEMGDKTQLATLALAAKYGKVIPVWLGTTAGMLIADAVGIGFGVIMGKKIPEKAIKWFAAIVFICFGLVGLHGVLPRNLTTAPVVVCAVGIVFAALIGFAKFTRRDEAAVKD